MSSLVTTADRSAIPRRTDEAGGELESLVGKIDPKDMGSRVARAAPTKKAESKMTAAEREEQKATASASRSTRQSHKDVIAATDELEGLRYRPRTNENRQVFELMLALIHTTLGDQPQDVIRSATDIVLEFLKDEEELKKDLDKKREIEGVLGATLDAQTFTELISLGKKITDYADEEQNEGRNPDEEKAEGEIDDDVGVAVVFEDDEEEDGQGGEEDEDAVGGFEIRGESDDEEDTPEDAPEVKDDNVDESVMIGGASNKKQSSQLTARDIDGFWLQRLIASVYPDPHEATTKTSDALALLSSESNARDLENSLMDLFDYNHFEITKQLVSNRERIVWCTRLARASETERMDVEVAMREKGVGYILKELSSTSSASKGASGMDLDEADAPKKANIAPGSLVQPRNTVDLESMIFTAGARLMSNKKCKLPEGSFKRTKKSYEEIHVPTPPKPAVMDKRVPITNLPEWSRVAFQGQTSLNPVQSRLYPVAFHHQDPDTTDEPLLLCAPTGAGKVSEMHAVTILADHLFFRPTLLCCVFSTKLANTATRILEPSTWTASRSSMWRQ